VTPERKPAAFDASALVALLQGREPAARQLAPILSAVFLGERPGIASFVNAAEAQYVLHETLAAQGQDIFAVLKHARILVSGPNKAQALLAAEAKRKVPDLSLGDAFAFALATRHQARLFTTDPAFDHDWIRERLSLTILAR
jgi:uncharacterized protein with PIN domain